MRFSKLWMNVPKLALFMSAAVMLCATDLRAEEAAAAAEKVTFDDHVQPILRNRCMKCHNPDKKSGGLVMASFSGLIQGGASGTVINPGNSGDSRLFQLITHQSQPFMPPGNSKIPDAEIAIIKKFIDGGALENTGSKPLMSKKPKFDLGLKGAPIGKPDGPPPMPKRLGLEPVIHASSATAITALATSPWAPLAAVAGQKQVLLYNTQSLELIGVLPFPEGVPYVLRFSSNGSLLLAGGGHGAEKGRVVVWSVLTGERIFEVGDEEDAVLAADISADQTRIALGGAGKVVKIYSTADGKLLNELKKHTEWITSIAFSPDGVLLATGDRNGGLMVWEAYTAREYLTLAAHTAAISGLSWRADANILASSSEDTTVRLWELENGGNVKGWGAHAAGATSVEFTRDGRLVSAGRDRTIRMWNQEGAQVRPFPEFSDIALQVTHCDETDRVIGADWTGAIRVWNGADAAVIGELTANPVMLATRLDEATKAVPVRQAESQKLGEAYATAQAAADTINVSLEAAKKALADAQTAGSTAAAVVKQSQDEIAKQTAEKDAAAKLVAAIEPLVAPLKDAAEKTQQAAAKAPEDKDLAAAAAQVKAQFDQKAAAFEAQGKIVAERTASLEKLAPQLAAAEKQVVDSKAAADAAQKQVETLTPTLAPAQAAAATAKQAADAAAQAYAAAQMAVVKWQGEIAYVGKLKEIEALSTKFDELAEVMKSDQENVSKLRADLAAAQQVVDATQMESDAAAAAVKQAADASAQAVATETATTQALAALETAIPLLKESTDKAAESAAKAPADKDIAAAAAAAKATFDKKAAELAARPKTLEDLKAAVAKSKEVVAAAEKVAADKATALAAAKKATDEKAATVKPAEDKLATSKMAADAAKAEVEKAKAALEGPVNLATNAQPEAGKQ